MADYRKYMIRPLQHGADLSIPSLNQPFENSTWGALNFKVEQRSIKKRRGYAKYRDLGTNVEILNIIWMIYSGGTAATVVLTDTDAIKIHAEPNTWEYINEEYTTGTANVDEAVGGTVDKTIAGTTTAWDTSADNQPESGDWLILDADYDADAEPNSDWREIDSITSDLALELVDTYGQNEVAAADYTIIKKYTVPDNERWSSCQVLDKLYFTNGDTNVQVYDGTGHASTLDSTDATKARYCIEYADRLVLADLYISGSRQLYTVKWSANGDPTDWTSSDAGSNDLTDTDDFITGLGKVGENLIVYKQDSLVIANKTGDPGDPIHFPRQRKGIGTPAPYSIVHAHDTNFFVGRRDFYMINGDRPQSIGGKVRDKFFEIVNPTEVKRVVGYHHELENEVRWITTDKDNNRWMFCFDYIYNEWTVNEYADVMSCGGKGASL